MLKSKADSHKQHCNNAKVKARYSINSYNIRIKHSIQLSIQDIL